MPKSQLRSAVTLTFSIRASRTGHSTTAYYREGGTVALRIWLPRCNRMWQQESSPPSMVVTFAGLALGLQWELR